MGVGVGDEGESGQSEDVSAVPAAAPPTAQVTLLQVRHYLQATVLLVRRFNNTSHKRELKGGSIVLYWSLKAPSPWSNGIPLSGFRTHSCSASTSVFLKPFHSKDLLTNERNTHGPPDPLNIQKQAACHHSNSL